MILSSGNAPVIRSYLDTHNLDSWFSVVYAAEPGADFQPIDKAETIEEVMSENGQALVIEDSAHHLIAARDLGAMTIGIKHSMNGATGLPAEDHLIVD